MFFLQKVQQKNNYKMKTKIVLIISIFWCNLLYSQNDISIKKVDKIVFYFNLHGDPVSLSKCYYNPNVLRAREYDVKVEAMPKYFFEDVVKMFFLKEKDSLYCYNYGLVDDFAPRIIIDLIVRGKIEETIAITRDGTYMRDDGMYGYLYRSNDNMIKWLNKIFGKTMIRIAFTG